MDHRNWSTDGETFWSYTVWLLAAGDDDGDVIDSDGFRVTATSGVDATDPAPHAAAENRLLARNGFSGGDVVEVVTP